MIMNKARTMIPFCLQLQVKNSYLVKTDLSINSEPKCSDHKHIVSVTVTVLEQTPRSTLFSVGGNLTTNGHNFSRPFHDLR